MKPGGQVLGLRFLRMPLTWEYHKKPSGLALINGFQKCRSLQLNVVKMVTYVLQAKIFTELGQVISLQSPGRVDSDQITFCDLTGTGIQDTAIANLAFQLCQKNKAGTNIIN